QRGLGGLNYYGNHTPIDFGSVVVFRKLEFDRLDKVVRIFKSSRHVIALVADSAVVDFGGEERVERFLRLCDYAVFGKSDEPVEEGLTGDAPYRVADVHVDGMAITARARQSLMWA